MVTCTYGPFKRFDLQKCLCILLSKAYAGVMRYQSGDCCYSNGDDGNNQEVGAPLFSLVPLFYWISLLWYRSSMVALFCGTSLLWYLSSMAPLFYLSPLFLGFLIFDTSLPWYFSSLWYLSPRWHLYSQLTLTSPAPLCSLVPLFPLVLPFRLVPLFSLLFLLGHGVA